MACTPPLRPGGAPPAPSISWGMALALCGAWGGAGSSWWPLPGSTSACCNSTAAPSAPASENAHRTSVHPKTLRELNMGVEASHPRSRVPGLAASALLLWCCELRGLVTTCQLSPSKEHHTRRTCPSNCLKGIICPACSDASCRHAQGGYDGVMRAPAVDCNFWSL